MKVRLITKLRIAALLFGILLLYGGFQAAVHPKISIVVPKTALGEATPRSTMHQVELRTSTASRVFGIVRLLVGGGLIWCVGWSTRPMLVRRQ